ncbi:hypothetical protein EmuJ_000510300 [Echinococcus multilocularis]|uniref:Calponin-homology (CH) domain-containing protein n=1 Tax=Echinococcus multilocularis TaxID=6211 RepID=A0A068XZZ6_ECHMU|nr:hypothetical protein EmuJ_000510300 [Echinococcus multilocularis]
MSRTTIPTKEKGFISQQHTIDPITTSGFIEIAYGKLDDNTICDTRILKVPFSATFEALSVTIKVETTSSDAVNLEALDFGCYPQSLDFGTVCLKTISSKVLKIKNCQKRPVLVQLHSDNYQVEIKDGTSRVISPHGTHGFKISVSPKLPGVFQGLLNLQVDGAPFDCIDVKAQAELPYLEIYPNEITLKPQSGSTCLISVDGLREFVCLKNNLNVPVHFRWTSNSQWESLKIHPEIGIVSPNNCQNCEITYRYSFNEGRIAGGKATFGLSAFLERPVHLEGVKTEVDVHLHLPSPKLTSTSKRIKLGDVPYGLEIVRTFRLRNIGGGPAFVEFREPSVVDGINLNVDPSRVEIRSQEGETFKVSNFDLMLPLIVNGKRITSDACRVTATSIRGLVNVSPRVISVELSPSIVKSPEIIQKEFQIESCANQVIQWQIDTSNLPSAISIECDGYQLNSHALEVPIIVEDDCNQSQMSFVTVLIKNVEVKLTCHPSHVILPPIPLSTRVDIDLHLAIDSVEYNFQLENIGFATWNEKLQKKCPFSVVLPQGKGESLMAYQRELDSGTSRVIERWLRHYGFPGGIRGLNFPIDFQRCLSLHYIQLQEQPQKSNQIVHSLDVLVECLAHMVGSWSLPGVPRSLTLPTDDTATCIGALYNHHAALVCFVESQGGCVGHIMPEYLMTYNDYLEWIRNGRPCGCDDLFYVDIPTKAALDGVSPSPTVILGNANGNVCLRYPLIPTLDEKAFDKTSRIAWVDLFLQLLKTLEIGKGTETKLLQWIKRSLVHGWTQLCEANTQFNTSTRIHLPRPRVKNFQEGLASGLALAAVIADQASFMKEEVLSKVNLDPKDPQLRFHNAVQVVKALALMRKAESFKFRGAANDIRTMELELTPNSASTLTLSFTVSSLHQCEAYLLLVSQRGYIPRGSTMVFRLIGKATGMKSEEVFNFKTTCYQAVIESIPIRNPFNAAGHFTLRIMESSPYCPDMPPGRLRGFSCRLSELFLHVERVTSAEVAFHPFSVGKYRGQLVLSNQDLGDFAIELRGCSTAFKTISSVNKDEIFKLRCPVNVEHCVNLQLPCKNLARYSAMEWVAEYCLSPLEMERIKISGELCNVVSKLLLFKDSDPLDTKKTRFQIKCDSSIVELPRFLDVDLGKSERSSRYVDLPLRIFCPKKEIHHINIILSAADDFRRFIVECEALEDNTTDSTADGLNYRKDMSMERFLADPTVFITEELEKLHPLTNRKDRGLCFYAGRIEIKCQVGDCTHKVDQSDKHEISLFLPKNKSSRTQLFRVESDFPTDILVPDAHVISQPNCRGRCRIVIPIKRRAYTFGKLLFREDSMDSRRIQQSDEPEIRLLYEVNIRIKPAPPIQRLEVICHCLKVNQIIIPLNLSTPLPSDDQHLQVTLEGDDLTGPNITEDVSIYTAEYRPTCVGKVKASAIFYNSNLSEFWVELTLVANPPLPQIVSPWRCELGRQCIGVVEIANPSRKSYHLSVEGVNDRVYSIDSYSLQKEGEMVPLEGANVPLPALSTLYLSVTFRPQEYGHCLNDGEIVLRSEELGELRVQLHGEGSLPTWNSEVCVTSEAGKSQLFSIFFTNPFPYPIDTRCALEAVNSVFDQEMEKASNAFEIRGERHLNLLGNQRKEFHLRFTPSLMHVYRARFEIVARKANLHDGGDWETREIAWSTPLRGTPTLRGTLELSPEDLLQELVHPRKQPKSVHPLLKVKAGTSTPIKLHLNLAGFLKDPDKDMVFNWRFVVDSCHEDTLVDADTVLRETFLLEQTKCDFVDPSDNVPHLELSGVFRPSRSFKIDASLCVTSKAGGMWVFPVHLEATLTQKVERRLIFSPQGLWKSDYKKLRLDSREETPAKFRAFLVKTGAGLFSINKTSGLLPAKDAGIFTLIVKFTRKSYGREVMDRLVIQTPTMEWINYEWGICEDCIEGDLTCHIFIRQLQQNAFSRLNPCPNDSEEYSLNLDELDDGYYQCAETAAAFCIVSLEGNIELRLSTHKLSAEMKIFVHIYVGQIDSAHHRQLWDKWIDDRVSLLGTEKAKFNTIVSGSGGTGPYKQLTYVPFDHAGSPTAAKNPVNNFYEVSKSTLTIRKGFCGDYRVFGVSAMVNQTFNVYIKNCSCKFHKEAHVGKLVGIQDYCDLFTKVEFTLKFFDVNGKTRCSVEDRQDLVCAKVGSNRFKIACLKDDLGIPENRDRSLKDIVLRLDSEKCLLRYVFKIPKLEYADMELRFTPHQKFYNPQNMEVMIQACLHTYCSKEHLHCQVWDPATNQTIIILKSSSRVYIKLDSLMCIQKVLVACRTPEQKKKLLISEIEFDHHLEYEFPRGIIQLEPSNTTFNVLGSRVTRKTLARVEDIKCFILGRRLTLQGNGFIDVPAAAMKKHLVKCQLYDCEWEFTLDTSGPRQNLERFTKKMDSTPWIGVKTVRIIIIVVLFHSVVFWYLSLVVILFIHYAKSDRRYITAQQWRQSVHLNDTIPPKYPPNFVSTVTLGSDLIAPEISHKVEELLESFQEVLNLRREIETHYYTT